MAITTLTLCLGYLICSRLLRIPLLHLLGVITGGMTSTPGLAAASSLSSTHYVSSAYATVYPVALIGMILFSKLLAAVL
jgi:putative transport protein